ncbi:MAG: VOC family protein [bacterium]|nr:VOC family protein [bacterium]
MAIPGLAGTEHIGFTVPDLEQAHDFFVNVIGAEYFFPLGPYVDSEGEWMKDHLGVDPRTVIRELRFYRCKNGPNFEIFQYETEDAQAPQPRNSDIGGHHLAFYVDDLDAAIEYLEGQGVEVMGGPTASSGSNLGKRWVYFRAPWGMQMELVSYPNGKAYEQETSRRLWHPGYPAE